MNFFDIYITTLRTVGLAIANHVFIYTPALLFIVWLIAAKKTKIGNYFNIIHWFFIIIFWQICVYFYVGHYVHHKIYTLTHRFDLALLVYVLMGLFISIFLALIKIATYIKKLVYLYWVAISCVCAIMFLATPQYTHVYFCLFICLFNPTLTFWLTSLNLLDKLEKEERQTFLDHMHKILTLKHINLWACVRGFFFYAHVHILVATMLNFDLTFLFVYVFLLVYPLKIMIQIFLTDISKRQERRNEVGVKLLEISPEYTYIKNEEYVDEVEEELLRILLLLAIMWILFFEITNMDWTPIERARSTFEFFVIAIRAITSLIFNFPPLIQSIIQTLQNFTKKNLNTMFYFQMFPVKFFILLLNKLSDIQKKNRLLLYFWIVIIASNLLSVMILMSILSENKFISFFVLCLIISWPARFFYNYSIASYKNFFKIAIHKNYIKEENYQTCNFLERQGQWQKIKELRDVKKVTFYSKLMQFVGFTWFLIFIPFTIYFWERLVEFIIPFSRFCWDTFIKYISS